MKRFCILAAVVLVACSSGETGSTPVTQPVTSTTQPSTTVVTARPVVPFTIEPCRTTQPRPWSLLCRAHDLVTAHHVDLPAPAELSAAATAGVLQADASSSSATSLPMTSCVIPDAAYEPVCEAISDRLRIDGLQLDAMVEAAVLGMFRLGLDPYSSYLVADYADRIDALGSGHVPSVGLIVGARDDAGAVCGPISSACRLLVLAVFDFSPAATEGVLVGDTIVEISGSAVEGLSETEAVAALHAGAGEPTLITVDRPTGEIDKTLVHEVVPTAHVEYATVSEETAYIRINDFSQEAAQAVGEVLSLPEVAGASNLILDLRDNPGGLVLSAQAVASQFLHTGIVLVEETRQGAFDVPIISGGLAPEGMEVVVVVNRGTASAAEIVAAALQGQGRATVVGEATFGKNLIQEVFVAPGGGEFRISVSRWVGPDGVDVGRGGLQPDVVVETSAGSDDVLDAALALLEG